MPPAISDGSCDYCVYGLQTACVHGGFFGNAEVPGPQAEAIRVPLADGTLYTLPVGEDEALRPSLQVRRHRAVDAGNAVATTSPSPKPG